MKKIFMVIVTSCVLISCVAKKGETLADNQGLKNPKIYEGTLPCADCSGIETILKIDQGDGTMEGHKFELTKKYKGKDNGKLFTESGSFNIERGLEDDPDGTVYVLHWNKPEADQIFYGYKAANPGTIYLLNAKREIIKSDLNYSLKLKN